VEQNFTRVLVVALGGAIGSGLRYLISSHLTSRFGTDYPWGTTVVNLTGALIFGLVWSATETLALAPVIRLFVLTGLMGGLTTFSTLAFEVTDALFNHRAPVAVTHLLVHMLAGILVVWVGLGVGRVLLRAAS
jgi:fluoride exporter